MRHYSGLLAKLFGLLFLCFAQLGIVAHAGFGGAVFRVDLTVATAPIPAVQPTVNGNFTYGITCTAPSGPVKTFASPAITIAVNAATPLSGTSSVSSGSFISAPNECTVAQLSRPSPPTGYLWAASAPNVVIGNVINDDPEPTYVAAFENVLSLPVVTGVANPPAGGTVSCTPLTTPGANSTCTAVANPNYIFGAFGTSGCGGPSGTSPYITSSPVLDNCTVTGSFSPLYTVTTNVNPPAGGTATCTSPVAAGTTSTCSATANAGFTFAGFSPADSNCGSASTTSPFITAPLSASCVVNAAFTPVAAPISPAAIPTLGHLAMSLLSLVLLIGGLYGVRRAP